MYEHTPIGDTNKAANRANNSLGWPINNMDGMLLADETREPLLVWRST